MARGTLGSGTYECIGGPFDGDYISSRDPEPRVQVSIQGIHHGEYVLRMRRSAWVLHWIPTG